MYNNRKYYNYFCTDDHTVDIEIIIDDINNYSFSNNFSITGTRDYVFKKYSKI